MAPGSSFTSKELALRLQQTMVAKYEAQLRDLPIKKALRDALVDGFRAGFATALEQLVAMDVIELVDTNAIAKGAPVK